MKLATEEELIIAEKVKFGENQEVVDILLAKRIAFLNEELERTKSQSNTNPESLTKLANLYDELGNLRTQITTKKTNISSTTNKLSYLFFFSSLVAIIAAIIVWLI